jgi:glycosyltransferase involved in cell wall biosynthesis
VPGLVVFSGNFEYHPNVDAVELLVNEIWPEVRRGHPEARLRLVGKGEGAVRRLVGGDGSIETTGPVEDALSEIAVADVAIAPLRIGSGTRLKIIEAWAAGRAVVATPLGAEGLRARDGENIRLAPDAAGFARAIGELLDDADLRARLGAAGHECFREFYSWEAAWRALNRGAQLSEAQQLAESHEDTRYRLADILVKPDAFCR